MTSTHLVASAAFHIVILQDRKTVIMALGERSLVLAGDRQDEAWMNVLVGNSEPHSAST